VDFATAENTGMDCVLVSWGFRTPQELSKFKPAFFIDQPEKLLTVLGE
jgi:phosphoglycolate phosphatase